MRHADELSEEFGLFSQDLAVSKKMLVPHLDVDVPQLPPHNLHAQNFWAKYYQGVFRHMHM